MTDELGQPAFDTNGRELVVRGHVLRTETGAYRAEVTLARASGEPLGVRSLTSDDRACRSLDEALVVMLGIMLNVSREELATPVASPWSMRLSLGGSVTVGRMPGPGAELSLSLGPTLPSVLGLDAELAVETGPSDTALEGSVRARAASVRLGVSPVLIAGTPELSVRAAAGGGVLEATAAGFDSAHEETLGMAEIRAGARLSVRIARPLWLEFMGDGGVFVLRPRFSVKNADGSREELFHPGPLFGALGLALAIRPQ